MNEKMISYVLIFAMIFSLCVSMNTFSVSAAVGDGTMDFDIDSTPAFTVSGQGTKSELYRYDEDNYTIQGRVSHPAHSWEFEQDALGKKGISILGKGTKDVAVNELLTDPCLIGFVNISNPAYLTSTDQYYTFEFDAAFTGNNSFEILATTDDGNTVVILNTTANEHKGLRSDALYQTADIYTAYASSWHNFKVVIKSADITKTDADATDTTAEDTHQYWIYANGNLIKSGTTGIKIRNSSSNLNSFAGFKSFQFRAYGINDSTTKTTTGDWSMRLDSIKTSVSDSLPETKWDGALTFDTLTDSTDLASINSELWAEEIGYFISGSAGAFTYLRNTTQALGSVEGGVYGKEASDKAISLSMDGNQTNGTHFFQLTQAGYGMNQMQRMGEGDYYEFQTYMAWEADSSNIGVQGFYSNTASNDGKGQLLLNIGAGSGSVAVLGKSISGINLSPETWYKFNIVVHSGNTAAASDDDQNWFNLYINDKLVAEKVVFTPTIRGGTQETFLGVDQYWFQVGIAAPNSCGKVYYDDIKIKYSESADGVYTPVTVSTTDEIAAKYIGSTGHVPGFGSYIDERVSYDAEKWSVTDGTIAFIPSDAKAFARIVKQDGTKIFDTFKKETKTIITKAYDSNSTPTAEFHYGDKDFTSYTFTDGKAGRDLGDYSFKMETIGGYDNWVMTKDADGNATTAEYQANSENWISKSDIPSSTTATYAFRDSYNPYVQLYKGTHTGALDFNAPWSVNISVLADGEYNTVDFQAISDDNGGRVTKNLFSLNKTNGSICVDRTKLEIAYGHNQWLNFVINVYPATKEMSLWYDGELVYDGEMDFPWERMARIKIQNSVCNSGHSNNEARDCKVMVDDMIFCQGSRFVPVAVNAAADTENFDASNIASNYIVADENTTVEQIASDITGGSVNVYDSKNYNVALGNAQKGNIVVVKSPDSLVYKYIYVANSSQEANAEIASSQSYLLGDNTFGPIYNTDNIVDGMLIVAAYGKVNDEDQLKTCKYASVADATYKYNGANFVLTPKTRVGITTPADTTSLKIFLWKNLTNCTPIAPEHDAKLKVE